MQFFFTPLFSLPSWDGTASFLNRCIPVENTGEFIVSAASAIFSNINADGVAAELVSDFENSWEIILYLCLISAAVAMLMVLLMRFVAWVLVWFCYWLSYVAIIDLAGFLWYTWKTTKDDNDASTTTQGQDDNEKWYFYGAIAWSIVGVS